jgi:uncharacterized protein YdeI (YjbR/CyaY-like superfamily)
MGKKDARVDAYIGRSAEFARPILKHLRKTVHAACPDAEETIKWGMPFFMHQGMLCMMAAFKAHCSFGIVKGKLVFGEGERDGMGHLGKITSLKDLPGDGILAGYIKKAAALNEAGVKSPKRARAKGNKELKVPDYFLTALKTNRKARETFENYSYTHRKEYVEWIADAKREETRKKRIETALKWLAAGKSRNWKYQKC